MAQRAKKIVRGPPIKTSKQAFTMLLHLHLCVVFEKNENNNNSSKRVEWSKEIIAVDPRVDITDPHCK